MTNTEHTRIIVSEIICSALDYFLNDVKNPDAKEKLIDAFTDAYMHFLCENDTKSALSLYILLYRYLNEDIQTETGSGIPTNVVLTLFKLTVSYMTLSDISVKQHPELFGSFIGRFKKHLKNLDPSDKIYDEIKDFAGMIPDDVNLPIISEDYHIRKYFCEPMELTDIAMMHLSPTKRPIPEGMTLIPFQNPVDDKWGFKDKKSGHTVIRPTLTAVIDKDEWKDGEIWVKKGLGYYSLDRNMEYKSLGILHKVGNIGYFFEGQRDGRYYYLPDKTKVESRNWVYVTPDHIVQKSDNGWQSWFSREDMSPIDIDRSDKAKVYRKFAKRNVGMGTLFIFIYTLLTQIAFLSDVSVVHLWSDMPAYAKWIYVLAIPASLIAAFVGISEILAKREANISNVAAEGVVSAVFFAIMEFWAILGIIVLHPVSGFWGGVGSILCYAAAGFLFLISAFAGLGNQPKIKGIRHIFGSRLSWAILSQAAVAANILIAMLLLN